MSTNETTRAAEGVSAPLSHVPSGSRSLWLVRGDEGYGVRRALLGMAEELRRRGMVIGFASLHDGTFADEIGRAGYPLETLGRSATPAGIRRRGWRFLAGVARLAASSLRQRRQLVAFARSFGAQWIHVRSNSLLVLAGLTARSCAIPAFWHLPNTISQKVPLGLQAAGCRLICRTCSVIPLANSRHTAASLDPEGARRVHVLYPGLNADTFSPEAAFRRVSRDALGFAPGLPVFVICARVVPDKAQDRVVAAAIDLLQSGRQLGLVLVGGPVESPFFQQILTTITRARAQSSIRMLGPVADPRPYLELADVVVNSRTGAEPFGLSVVEAMLMQRPVLAYALGGPSETVIDGRTGWLTADPTVHGYRRGLERALADAPRWREFGRAGRIRAAALFSVQATVTTYLAIVARCLEPRQDARLGCEPVALPKLRARVARAAARGTGNSPAGSEIHSAPRP